MNRLFSFLAIALLFVLPSCAGNSAVIKAAHKTTHKIRQQTIVEGASCSATAIGVNALLTASHCELPTDTIVVDGNLAHVLGIIRDGNDHTIYLLDIAFTDYASFAKALPEIGDDIFAFGNPSGFTDLFRRGTVAGITNADGNFLEELLGDDGDGVPQAKKYYFDFNGWPGDSGAALFNQAGEILGVISVGKLIQPKSDDSPWPVFKIMGGFSFGFTPVQLAQAAAFRAPVKPKPPVALGNFGRFLRQPPQGGAPWKR